MGDSNPQNEKQSGTIEIQEESTTENLELNETQENVENAFSQLQEELTAVQDRYLRLGAEFENFKKRSERDRLASIRFANEGVLSELLPVLDNLEHAISAAASNPAAADVVTGVQMVLKQFKDVASKSGLKSFDSVGNPFNPNLHEALAEAESEEHDSGIVIQEYQKGYMLNDRLIRPARVVVSKKKTE